MQADLAAAATDNELVVEEKRRLATKSGVDPVKTVGTMFAVLGGKLVLLQGVRFILSICLLVTSAAVFYTLITYTSLNVALSLAVVVAANVLLATALLLIVILQKPGNQGGLADLFRRGSRSEQVRVHSAPMLYCTPTRMQCRASFIV